MIKVGLVGLGHMGLLHLRNTKFIENIKVVAVSDKSKKSLSEAKSLGIRNIYRDYKDLVNLDNIDAAIISLPNFLHEESILLCAEKGLDIFVEKPLARNISECENIRRAVHRNNIVLAVGHNYRHFDHVQKLKQEYDIGKIGDIELANLSHFVNGPFAHPLEPKPIHDWWLDKKASGGGVLLDQGSHLIDLFRWFFSDSVLLYANLGYRYNLELEDSAILVIQSKKTQTRGIISVGWFQKMVFPQFNFRIRLEGTARSLSTDDFAPKNLYSHAIKAGMKNILLKAVGKRIYPLSYTYYHASYFSELYNFFKCIETGVYPSSLVTVDDGIEIIKTVQKAYESASQKDNQSGEAPS